MAKSQEQKDAEAKAKADAKALADAEANNNNGGGEGGEGNEKGLGDIFGAQAPKGDKDPVTGIVKAPAKGESTGKSTPSQEEGSVTLSRTQFDSIMNRLNDLDNVVQRQGTPADNVFNPLAEVKSNHVVRVGYYVDDLVVGYKAKIRPDGKQTFTFMKKEEATGEVRTYITVLLEDAESKMIKEVTMDYVLFLQEVVMIDAVVKERKDIGKLVEQGLVEVQVWNGRQMVGTGQQIMTGAREQKFVFNLEINGKAYTLPEEVVNIK